MSGLTMRLVLVTLFLTMGLRVDAVNPADNHVRMSLVTSCEEDLIAFQSNRDGNWEIYVMNADGSAARNLTRSEVDDFMPAWSPDGSQLVFISYRDGDLERYVMVMNADGSDLHSLTGGLGDVRDPVWSPDGSQLAFVAEYGFEASGIFVMNADGSDVHNLSEAGGAAYHYDFSPAWSPDGSQLVYACEWDVCVMNADGSDVRNLTRTGQVEPGSEWVAEQMARWSPDGSQLVFVADRDGNRQIYLMAADGSDVRRLTETEAENLSPAWSPDGSQIVFASERDGNREIYVMNADGSEPRNLTQHEANDSAPVWSPCAVEEVTQP